MKRGVYRAHFAPETIDFVLGLKCIVKDIVGIIRITFLSW